jgi:arylsulfatase A
VFFTSDHGSRSGAGQTAVVKFFDSNGPLRGYKRDMTEGGIRVPMIVRWPGKIEAGSMSDHAGAFWDVLPTLADLGGAAKHVPKGLDGLSFAPAILGKGQQKKHDHLYWAFYERGGARALRMGKWKAVQQPIHTAIRLYNLEEDLGEETDIAKDQAGMVAVMSRIMDLQYKPSAKWKFPAPKSKLKRSPKAKSK